MSIAVELADLPVALAAHAWGYLITVSDEQRAHSLAVPTRFEGGALVAAAGASTRANVLARPKVTMVFPPAEADGHSLIVDGHATVTDGEVHLTPTSAVLHRPAPAPPS